MILQALCGFYTRELAAGEAIPYGFAMQNASIVIVIDREGDLRSVYSIEERIGKKLVPASLSVPISPKRAGQKPEPAFLCENVAFLFGIYDKPKDAQYRFDASRNIHRQVLEAVSDEGSRALLRFFDKRVQGATEYEGVDTSLLKDPRKVAIFRLEGDTVYLHERPLIRDAWSAFVAKADADAPVIQCLVTGEEAPLARLHGNVSGFGQDKPTLVSFKPDSFNSFGKKQGENAPVGVWAAFAYVTALNILCRDRRHHTNLAGDKLIYWAERDAPDEEALVGTLFDEGIEQTEQPEKAEQTDAAETTLDAAQRDRVRGMLATLTEGGDPRECSLDPDVRFYIVGLCSNKTRLVVRFFHESTFGDLIQNAIAHYRDIGVDGMKRRYPSPREILLTTAFQRKADNVPAPMENMLMRSILERRPYPQSLYMAVLNRIRHDAAEGGQLVSPLRAGLIKGYLIRETKEEFGMGLDRSESDRAYLFGRLFALLERAQGAAIENLNASIADKYLNSALASPQTVFPTLLALSQKHISKIFKEKAGMAVNLSKEMQQILGILSLQSDGRESYAFPASLNANEQGKFLLGYYHQTLAGYTKADKADGDTETQSTEDA